MQTFLPYPSFVESARCLDNKRLGKQRVEVLTILRVLECGPYQMLLDNGTWIKSIEFHPKHPLYRKTPWYNHPAVKMWRGYEEALTTYGYFICSEWSENRGFKDSCRDLISKYDKVLVDYTSPHWLGNEQFHASHRSNLLRKDFEYYKQFNWTEPNNLPHVWPVA